MFSIDILIKQLQLNHHNIISLSGACEKTYYNLRDPLVYVSPNTIKKFAKAIGIAQKDLEILLTLDRLFFLAGKHDNYNALINGLDTRIKGAVKKKHFLFSDN